MISCVVVQQNISGFALGLCLANIDGTGCVEASLIDRRGYPFSAKFSGTELLLLLVAAQILLLLLVFAFPV